MAIATTQLTAGSNATDATSFATASVTPTADAVVWLAVTLRHGTVEPAEPTISGCNLTWTLVNPCYFDTSTTRGKMFLFRGHSAAPTAEAITITATGGQTLAGAVWHVSESTGVDSPATPLVQSAVNAGNGTEELTARTVTFAAAPTGAVVAWLGVYQSGTVTDEAGYTRVGRAGPEAGESNLNVVAMWRADGEQTPSWTWGTIDLSGALAVEVAESGGISQAVTPAAETDAAQVIAVAGAVLPAVETDTAQTVTVSQTGGAQSQAIASAVETDEAVSVTKFGDSVVGLGFQT